MKYTDKHPRAGGWYWWQEDSDYPPVVIKVLSDMSQAGIPLCRTEYGYKKITDLPGRFAGPIPEPFDDRPWFCIECKHDGNIGSKCDNCLMPRQ